MVVIKEYSVNVVAASHLDAAKAIAGGENIVPVAFERGFTNG
jgi:hypothetical protein